MNKHYVKIITFVLGIICCSMAAPAQQLDDITKGNTFFILFESGELQKKTDMSRLINDAKEIRYSYTYYYKRNIGKQKFDFSFHFSKYPTYDDAFNDINAAMIFKLNKSFLRKNKDLIITRNFIQKVGENVLIDLLFRTNTHIFLIDKSEIKDKKILLRQVRFHHTPVEPEPVLKNIEDNY